MPEPRSTVPCILSATATPMPSAMTESDPVAIQISRLCTVSSFQDLRL